MGEKTGWFKIFVYALITLMALVAFEYIWIIGFGVI